MTITSAGAPAVVDTMQTRNELDESIGYHEHEHEQKLDALFSQNK